MATSPDSDPQNWRLSVSEAHLALYSDLGNEPRELTPSEARMMVELVDAWRTHEHRKHIALMAAVDSHGSLSPPVTRSHRPGVKIEAHAVVRHDPGVDDIGDAVYVVEVLPTRSEADAEVERLNQVNLTKGSRYFYSPTRWYPTGRSPAN